MSLGGRKHKPVVVETIVPPAELDVTVDRARIALAVTLIDAYRLYQSLLEVRHALAPGMRPLDPPVPVIPGRSR